MVMTNVALGWSWTSVAENSMGIPSTPMQFPIGRGCYRKTLPRASHAQPAGRVASSEDNNRIGRSHNYIGSDRIRPVCARNLVEKKITHENHVRFSR